MSLVFPNQTQSTYLENGFSWDITGYKTPIGKGIYGQHNPSYNIIPYALDPDIIAGNALGEVGYQVPYETTVILPDQGTQTPTIVYAVVLRNTSRSINNDNNRYIFLDCDRVPFIRFFAPTISATEVYITGLDNNFKTVISKIAVPAGTAANTYFTKSFSLISEVYFTARPGVTISIGAGDKFGLPQFVSNVNYIHTLTWNGTALSTATFTPGVIWRQTSNNPLDALFNAPTVTSGDAHGIIDLTGEVNLPNAARMLSVHYYLYGTDSELNADVSNAAMPNNPSYQTSPVLQVQLQANASGNYVKPYFVEQDTFGAQFPADQVFMNEYRLALAQ